MHMPNETNSNVQHKEIEARFLEIDKTDLVARLMHCGAKDCGEAMLKESIFYDQAMTWNKENKFIRVRQNGKKITITYKHHAAYTIDGTEEIEVEADDFEKSCLMLQKAGLLLKRRQEKKRHTFLLDGVVIDIDTWPRIPTYVEIEGASESAVRGVAEKLGFTWSEAVFDSAGRIIEDRYGVPVLSLEYFIFDSGE